MAAGYNRVVLIGNLTRDPEFKELASGQGVCRLGLAVNRQYRNRQSGEMVQEVCFVDIDVWGAQAESSQRYLEKGRQVLVEGRLKLDTWQDSDGSPRSKHSIVAERVVFLSSNADASSYGEQQQTNTPATKEQPSVEELQKQVAAMQKTKPATADNATKEKNNTKHTGEVAFKDEPPFQDDLPF